MSNYRVTLIALSAMIPCLSGGCPVGGLLDLLGPSGTTVQLVNTSNDFALDVELYTGEDQNALELTLTEFGERRQVTVPAGETRSFTLSCDKLQAIIIDRAELVLIGDIGPDQKSRVYRDGSDFNCGDTLVFTFSHPALPLSLDIAYDTR